MSSQPWFKFYGSDFRDGVHDLKLEEVGAYTILLTRMYEAPDGLVEDRDRLIAGWLNCDIRVWKRIRATLLSAGKLYVDGGRLGNARVTKSKTSAELVSNFRRTSGKRGGYVSAQVRAKSLKSAHTDEAKSKQNRSRYQKPEPEESLSLSGERDSSLANAQARTASEGQRACAPLLRLVTEKGLSEMSEDERESAWADIGAKPNPKADELPAWMNKPYRYLTREEKALADAWDAEQDAKRKGPA